MAYGAVKSYPSTAYILSLIGGIFIALSGLITMVAAAILASVAFDVGVPGVGGLLIAFGLIGLILGILVLYGALQLKHRPETAKTWGLLIIVFSLISYIGGGGFFLGLVLGLVGGILALVWTPPPTPAPGYGQPMAPGAPAWGQPVAPPAAGTPSAAAAGGQRFCSSCGSPNAAGATFCAKCGAPLGSA